MCCRGKLCMIYEVKILLLFVNSTPAYMCWSKTTTWYFFACMEIGYICWKDVFGTVSHSLQRSQITFSWEKFPENPILNYAYNFFHTISFICLIQVPGECSTRFNPGIFETFAVKNRRCWGGGERMWNYPGKITSRYVIRYIII